MQGPYMDVRQVQTLNPRRGSNPQPSDDQWDVLTIALEKLGRKAEATNVW